MSYWKGMKSKPSEEVIRTYIQLMHRKEDIEKQMKLLDKEWGINEFIVSNIERAMKGDTENNPFKIVRRPYEDD